MAIRIVVVWVIHAGTRLVAKVKQLQAELEASVDLHPRVED